MTKIILAYELLEQGISEAHVAERLDASCRTVIRRAQTIEQSGNNVPFVFEILDHSL